MFMSSTRRGIEVACFHSSGGREDGGGGGGGRVTFSHLSIPGREKV